MVSRQVVEFPLGSTFDCFFFGPKALFFFKVWKGVVVLFMPSLFFFRRHGGPLGGLVFGFSGSIRFKVFLRHFFFLVTPVFYFLRLKVRGLGFRIKNLGGPLFRFFIGTTNFYFFHAPPGLLVRVRRRRMLLVSPDSALVHLVFAHLLLLKKIIPYKLRGLFFPKQILLLKPGKKSF